MLDTNTNQPNFFRSTPFIVFLIAAAIVGLGWYSGLFESLFSSGELSENESPIASQSADTEYQSFDQIPIYSVESTELPFWFPEELIVEDGVSTFIVTRFSVRSPENEYREIVRWDSFSSMEELAAAYRTYFAQNGWTVEDEVTELAGRFLFIATRAPEGVRVDIESAASGSEVEVSYTWQ